MEYRVSNKELLMSKTSLLIGVCLGFVALSRPVTLAQQSTDVSASLSEAETMCGNFSDSNKMSLSDGLLILGCWLPIAALLSSGFDGCQNSRG